MDWTTELCIGISVALIVGILLYRPINDIRVRNKNLRDAAGKVGVVFFDSVTNNEEFCLRPLIDHFKITPPVGHKMSEGNNGHYILVPNAKLVKGEDGTEELVAATEGAVGTYAVTTRALYPENKRINEQVQIQKAYFKKGDPRPMCPHRDFAPVNIDRMVEIFNDVKTGEALAAQMKFELENIQGISENMVTMAKKLGQLVVILAIGLLLAAGLAGGALAMIIQVKSGLGL